jgi:drug/metabolite transporter (DMT)-like permease
MGRRHSDVEKCELSLKRRGRINLLVSHVPLGLLKSKILSQVFSEIMADRLLLTSHGINREAFNAADWARFVSIGLIWGSSFLLMAIGIEAFHPGFVTWLRVMFASVLMWLLPKARSSPPIQGEDRQRVALIAVTWVMIPLTLFPIAQQWIDSAVAGMLNGAVPIFTAVIASILLRQLPGRLQLAGLLVGFAGILAITLPSVNAGTTAAVGVAMVLVATVCYGLTNNLLTPMQQRYGTLPMMARVIWLGALLVTPYGIYGATQSQFAWQSLAAVAALGVLGTGVAFVMMGTLAGSVGPTRASFITYLIPVVALVLGVVFRDEIVAPVAIGGAVLVIFGAILASRRESPEESPSVDVAADLEGDEAVLP